MAAREARILQAWGTSVRRAKRGNTVAPVQRRVPDALHTAQPCRQGARAKHSVKAYPDTNVTTFKETERATTYSLWRAA